MKDRCIKPVSDSRTAARASRGFTLIECLIAMVITTVGLLATAGLISVGIRLQVESRDALAASALARAKIEELQNFAPTATERARGGNLGENIAGYHDFPDARFVRRWRVETSADAGVPVSTQRITVALAPRAAGIRLPAIELATLAPAE